VSGNKTGKKEGSMEVMEAIKNRHSVREYADSAIPREDIRKIISAAIQAPTARKLEPWEFIAVENRETLVELGKLADHGKFIENAAFCIAVFCSECKYYLEDGCAATENILLAATSMGIGSCWVAGDKKDYVAKVSDLLGVPSRYKLVSLISLGIPAGGEKSTRKRGTDEVLHWNFFNKRG
jgi:nitroreductase